LWTRYTIDGEVYGYVYGVNAEAVVCQQGRAQLAGITDAKLHQVRIVSAARAAQSAWDAGIKKLFQINMEKNGWPMQQWDKAALLFAGDGIIMRER
jgi:hypothetical protein